LKKFFSDNAEKRILKDNETHVETVVGNIARNMAIIKQALEQLGELVNDQIATEAMIEKQKRRKKAKRRVQEKTNIMRKKQREEEQKMKREEEEKKMKKEEEIDLYEPRLYERDEKQDPQQASPAAGGVKKPVKKPRFSLLRAMAGVKLDGRADGVDAAEVAPSAGSAAAPMGFQPGEQVSVR